MTPIFERLPNKTQTVTLHVHYPPATSGQHVRCCLGTVKQNFK
jgi:hypothetical protein